MTSFLDSWRKKGSVSKLDPWSALMTSPPWASILLTKCPWRTQEEMIKDIKEWLVANYSSSDIRTDPHLPEDVFAKFQYKD